MVKDRMFALNRPNLPATIHGASTAHERGAHAHTRPNASYIGPIVTLKKKGKGKTLIKGLSNYIFYTEFKREI